MKNRFDWGQRRSGEVGLARLPHDSVFAHLEFQPPERIASGRGPRGGHGVGGVVNTIRPKHSVRNAKQGRRDVDAIGNEADPKAWCFENAPEHVIETVEFIWNGVAQVGEPGAPAFTASAICFCVALVWPKLILIPRPTA